MDDATGGMQDPLSAGADSARNGPDGSAASGEPRTDASASAPPPAHRRRSRLGLDLSLLAVIGVLLISAFVAGGAVLYHELYSPSAFVLRYLGLLSDGRATDALAMPGVTTSSSDLEAAGLTPTASEALLRRAALAPLTDVSVLSEEPAGDVTQVTVSYRAGTVEGRTTFEVARAGTIGVAPTWRFAESPLAVIELTVRGSMAFEVNGFSIDKRQISPDGADADPLAALSLLVFSPGLYSVSVDTAISSTPGVVVLSDSPLTRTPVSLQAQATEQFRSVVQEEVEQFLTTCATQQVLQPTGCPFGFLVQDRIVSPPTWSISRQPTVQVEPDGAAWKIPPAESTAHIEVGIRSLFDGSVRQVSEDVPFLVTGSIVVLPDGTASISVSGIDPL